MFGRVKTFGYHKLSSLVFVGTGFGSGIAFLNDDPEGRFRIDPGDYGSEIMDIHIGQKE